MSSALFLGEGDSADSEAWVREEVEEIPAFLKDPKKYTRLGGRVDDYPL